MGLPDHLSCLLRNLYEVKKQQLEPDMEQQTSSKLGKEYIKAVYCHTAYSTYMQSISYDMLGWDEVQVGIEIATNGRKQGGTEEPLSESERGE